MKKSDSDGKTANQRAQRLCLQPACRFIRTFNKNSSFFRAVWIKSCCFLTFLLTFLSMAAKYKQECLEECYRPPPPRSPLCVRRGEEQPEEEVEEEEQVVEWAFTQVWAPPRSGRSGFNGPARPARVSENLALYLLPRPAGYFSWAELAPSLITSYCCREGLLHHELFLFFFFASEALYRQSDP